MNLRDLLTIPDFFPFQSQSVVKKEEPRLFSVESYLNKESSKQLYDEMDYQRAVQAYIWAVPLVNSVAFDKALTKAGVSSAEPSILVFNQLITPKQIIMTANSEVIYACSVVDLSKTGPLIVDAPIGVLGIIFDYWQRGVGDIGINPMEGSRFVLLPPNSSETAPADYKALRSRTNKVFIVGRGILRHDDSPDQLVKLVSNIKIFRLADKDQPKPTPIILNEGRAFDSDWPKDLRYFDYMAEGLADEVVQPEDKLMYGMLRPLEIGPGKLFKPDNRTQKILSEAAAIGSAMVANMAFTNRTSQRLYWPDRQWEPATFVTRPDFNADDAVQVDQRAQAYYQILGNGLYIYGSKPKPGIGSWYVQTYRDIAGEFLMGSRNYQLHLNSDPPAKNFWSITVYDVRTRSQIDTNQQRANLSSYSDLVRNSDGSIDLYFGPKAPKGMDNNWIKTIPGEGFFAMFRLYGPLDPVLKRSWRLDDIEEVEEKSPISKLFMSTLNDRKESL